MNFATIEDIGLAVGSFLRGEYPIAPVVNSWKSRLNVREPAKLNFLKEAILEFWDQYTIPEKIKIIGIIADAIHSEERHVGADPKIKQRIVLFKATFASAAIPNWKDALLGLRLQPVFSKADKTMKYYIPISSELSADAPIRLNSPRFRNLTKTESTDAGSYAIIGSTFTTNRASILADNPGGADRLSGSHILDASYCAYTLDADGEVNGAVVAVADGCGGHFGNAQQDLMIAKTAYVASRHAVRLMAAYDTPESLIRDTSILIDSIRNEIARKYYRNPDGVAVYQEGTTLACGRGFKVDTGYRFVGLAIGDSMIGAWHPEKKIWQTLAPGRVKIFRQGQTATAIFPTAYHLEEIHPIDVMLAPGTVLIPLTDGVYDYLPCKRVRKVYADGSDYQETVLNDKAMQKLLTDKDALLPQDVITKIAEYVVEKIDMQRKEALIKAKIAEKTLASLVKNQEKQEHANKNNTKKEQSVENDQLQQLDADRLIQLGDDFTLFGVRLAKKELHAMNSSSSSSTSTVAQAQDELMLTVKQ